MNVDKVGMNIQICRVNKGMTIPQLSKLGGVSVTTISRIERGIGKPRMFSIKKIADALKVSIEELID